MLECNRNARKKVKIFSRVISLLLPVVCIVLLLSQTAFAQNTYLINDGGRVMIHTTYATDPAEVLNEAGLTLGKDDTYTTQENLGMPEITVQRMKTVEILYGGKTLQISCYAETVADLLQQLDIVLTENDVISEAQTATVYDGMVLTVSRTITQEETYTTSIPFITEYCYDASLKEGEQVVLTEGVEGQMQCTAKVHYVNGEEVSRTVLSQKVTLPAVNALIAIGTYVDAPDYSEPQEPAPPVVETPKPTPSKPAAPVITENTIITPDGEVLTYTGTMQAVATAYHNTDPGCTIYTYIGTLCRVGAIAVDPKVIPYGTRMYIVSNDGKYVYGIAVAEDCGGAIKGNRIDLYYDTVPECLQFGIRDCTIYFLG